MVGLVRAAVVADDKISLVETLLHAAESFDRIFAAVRPTSSYAEAVTVLMAPPFSFSEIQSHHILALRVRG